MKRVLIITYYWPPAGGSGVQRWVKFSKYLPSEGWQPVIYTPLNPDAISYDDTLLKDIPQEAEILKTHIVEPYSLGRKLMGDGIAKSSEREVNPINGRKKSFKQSLSLWIRGNLFIPDPRVWWIRPSVKFLVKYLKEHPVDAVVTTGPPHSMHLIGREVHRATGIPWVSDFRDPWTKMYYYKHLRLTWLADRVHHRQEQSVLDESSAVISVTPLVQREFQATTKTPIYLITNGFDEDDFSTGCPSGKAGADSTSSAAHSVTSETTSIPAAAAEAETAGVVCEGGMVKVTGTCGTAAGAEAETAGVVCEGGMVKVTGTCGTAAAAEAASEEDRVRATVTCGAEDGTGEFRVTHTGLFANTGNPLALWDVLAEMCAGDKAFANALRIRLSGKVDAEIYAALEERGLGGKVQALGYLPHDEAVAEQRSAGLLILPLRQEPEYRSVLPGKIFEYLAARRPVLGIGQEDGAAAKVLADAEAGVMCDWDHVSGIRDYVEKAWKLFCEGARPAPSASIDRYSRRSLTRDLVRLLDSLLP